MKKIASRKDSRVIDLLIAHGPAGYGVYVMLVEYLSGRKAMRSRADLARIAYELHADAEMVRSVLEDFNLFDSTPDTYYNLGKAPAEEPSQTEDAFASGTRDACHPGFIQEPEFCDTASEPAQQRPQTASMKRRDRRKRLRQFRC